MLPTLLLITLLAPAETPVTLGPPQWWFNPVAPTQVDIIMPIANHGEEPVIVRADVETVDGPRTLNLNVTKTTSYMLKVGTATIVPADDGVTNHHKITSAAVAKRVAIRHFEGNGDPIAQAEVKLPKIIEVLSIKLRQPKEDEAGASLVAQFIAHIPTPLRRRGVLTLEIVDGEGESLKSEAFKRPRRVTDWVIGEEHVGQFIRARFDYPRKDGIVTALKKLRLGKED